MKNFSTRWGGNWGRKPKDYKCRYYRWKNLPTWTKDRIGKTVIDEKEGLGQNKVLFSFRIKLQMAKPPNAGFPMLPAPEKEISGYLPASGSRKSNWLGFLLVASLDTLCSTSFCYLSLLLFGRELDCWSSYWWRGVDGRRSRCWLIRIVFVECADEFSKVLDRWNWLPGILFFLVSFPRYQVVEA